jgi:shikimate dehydrogenase
MNAPQEKPPADRDRAPESSDLEQSEQPVMREIGGPPGPEPTRYGDWEKAGRCIDF